VETIISSISTGKAAGVGIPIGNLTSQLFANIYLDQVDHFAKERLGIRHYIRYMDDFAIFSNSKEQLRQWREAIVVFLQGIGLILNPIRTMLGPTSAGINWLGFRVLQPGMRRLVRHNVIRAARMVHILAYQYRIGQLDAAAVGEHLKSWAAHASYAQTWRLRQSLFNSVKWSVQ